MKSGKMLSLLLKIQKQVGYDHANRHTLIQYASSKYLDALARDP